MNHAAKYNNDKQNNSEYVQTRRKSVAALLSGYILWGLLPVFWKTLSELDPFYVLASRIVWSGVFCSLIVLLRGNIAEVKAVFCDRVQMRYLAAASIAVTVNWGSYIYAISIGLILDASLAYYLNPLISIALGFLIFKEQLGKIQWIAIGIAALGITAAIVMYGVVPYFAFIMGGSFAIYGAIKKNVTCSGFISTLIEALLIAPFALLYMIVAECRGAGALSALQGAELLLLPMAGVVTAIPLLAYSYGVARVPMSLSGILMYINPTLQLLVGVALYGEVFDLARGIMFASVWIALILFIRRGGIK